MKTLKRFGVFLVGAVVLGGMAAAQISTTGIATAATGAINSAAADASPVLAVGIAVAIGWKWIKKLFKSS